jgi:hypothetical protein
VDVPPEFFERRLLGESFRDLTEQNRSVFQIKFKKCSHSGWQSINSPNLWFSSALP